MNTNIPFRAIAILSLLTEAKSPDGMHLHRMKERLVAADPSCQSTISSTLTRLKQDGFASSPLPSMWAITDKGLDHLIKLQEQEAERKKRKEADEAAKAIKQANAGASSKPAPAQENHLADSLHAIELSVSRLVSQISEKIDDALKDHKPALSVIARRVDDVRVEVGLARDAIKLMADRHNALEHKLDVILLHLSRPLQAVQPGPTQNITDAPTNLAPPEPVKPIQVVAKQDDKKVVVRKPSILVVGLLNQQMQRVSKRYSRFVDLSFIDSQKANVHKIKDACGGRDHILQMTAFTSHSVDDAVRCATGKPPTRIDGSVSSLTRELDRILLEHNTAK